MPVKNYDYIFLGAGCASLSILMRMIASGKFDDKKILLVEREPKIKNDRTWCFWEKEDGFFEDIVYRKWNHLSFKDDGSSTRLHMGNYQYKMVRGIDFYNHCFPIIQQQVNIDIRYGELSVNEKEDATIIKVDEKPLELDGKTLVFNSIYLPGTKQKGKFYLLQHFKGWIVEAPRGSFNAEEAILMDFRVPQGHGTTFVYALPLSSSRLLVEYTLFTANLLPAYEYERALKNYMQEFSGITQYNIEEEEFGLIPMTNAPFPYFRKGVYYIGTAGGQTKPSTGYTFRFIQKQADSIVEELVSGGRLSKKIKTKKRFLFYDSTLLHIISKNLLPGKTIFSILFKNNRADKVLKFLDNETTIAEELKLLNSLPKKIFIKAGFIEFTRMLIPRKKS